MKTVSPPTSIGPSRPLAPVKVPTSRRHEWIKEEAGDVRELNLQTVGPYAAAAHSAAAGTLERVIMTNWTARHVSEAESDRRGIKDGWYAISKTGKVRSGRFSNLEDCQAHIKRERADIDAYRDGSHSNVQRAVHDRPSLGVLALDGA